MKFECGKEPQFKCPHCPHRTKHKSSLQVHVGTKHPEQTLINSREFHIAMTRTRPEPFEYQNRIRESF